MEARLLIDGPLDGAWNMAVDEALLETVAVTKVPCVRFYRWSEPTLSLGYFQSWSERESHAASRECAWVRRSTGGGAILHDQDLTYSLAAPIDDPRFADHRRLYDLFHTTLIAELAVWGVTARLCELEAKESPAPLSGCGEERRGVSEPFLCFQRRAAGDVLVGPWKVGGSAQRRHRGALLQHGSVLLGRSPSAPELPGIRELAGVELSADQLQVGWAARVAERLGVEWRRSSIEAVEIALARRLELQRYRHSDWNRRR